MVFKKFNGYWQKGKPFLDQVEIKPITDTLTREFSLRKGELNAMVTFAGESLAAFEKDGFVVTRRSSGSGGRFLVPDSGNPNSPFAKVKVRQATQHAIDTQAIAKTIFYGEAEPANQLTYKGYWAYNPSVVGYPYDPAKARRLLSEAGYGSGFKTKITYYTNRENDLLFSAVQSYLKAVGIDLELNPTQMAGWSTVLTGAQWEGLYVGRAIGGTDPVLMLSKLYSGTGKAFVSMSVPADYAKAVQKAVIAPNFKEKQKWTHEAWKLMIDKYALVLPITCTTDFIVTNKSLRQSGFNETPYTAQWSPEEAWLDRH